MAALTALGVGIKFAIKDTAAAELTDAHRWLLCGSLALAFLALFVIRLGTVRSHRDLDLWLRLGTAAVALGVGVLAGGLGPLPVTALLVLAVAGQVGAEIAHHERHLHVE
jgi:hypothetical protein